MQEMTASETKKLSLSETFQIRSDATPEKKLDLMEMLLRQKFSDRNPALKQQLIETGNALLIEGNDWDDMFWGFSLNHGYGQNNLGQLLMKIRDSL